MLPLERRTDLQLARAIERAIWMERAEGPTRAWSYLKELGLSANAIRRLLDLDSRVARRRRASLPVTVDQPTLIPPWS